MRWWLLEDPLSISERYWPPWPVVTCCAVLQPKEVQFWPSESFPSFLKKFRENKEETQQWQTRFWRELGSCSSLSMQAAFQSLNCAFLRLNEAVTMNLQQLHSARPWPSRVLRRSLKPIKRDAIARTLSLEHIFTALLEVGWYSVLKLQGRDCSGRGSNNKNIMTKKLPVHCRLSGNTRGRFGEQRQNESGRTMSYFKHLRIYFKQERRKERKKTEISEAALDCIFFLLVVDISPFLLYFFPPVHWKYTLSSYLSSVK